MEQHVRKSRFRLIHYILFLFYHDVIKGTAAQRHKFIDRMTRRILSRMGYYRLARKIFVIRLAINGLVQPATIRALQRKNRDWLWAISSLNIQPLLRDWILHHGRPHILVLGMGSVGDILQITPVLRSLRAKYPTAQIVLLHRSPAAKTVLRGNKATDAIALADFHHFDALKSVVARQGIADLVVEVQSISYVVSYVRAPLAYRHPLIDQVMPETFFAAADIARTRWQKHPPIFPRKDHKFVWPEEWRGFQYLDVLGTTGNLPINRHSALDFTIQPDDAAMGARLFNEKKYVTVQNGVDADVVGWSRVTDQRPTKLLPQQTWIGTVKLLRDAGLTVVQLGTLDDEYIDGVTFDLRGKTRLGEAAALLKHALCHVGTEGGLVHLAYAVGTPAVVMFGPTSVEFLGYPTNTNIVASDCTSCWWTTKDWFIYCPRGLKDPECMGAHRATTIVDAVKQIAARGV